MAPDKESEIKRRLAGLRNNRAFGLELSSTLCDIE